MIRIHRRFSNSALEFKINSSTLCSTSVAVPFITSPATNCSLKNQQLGTVAVTRYHERSRPSFDSIYSLMRLCFSQNSRVCAPRKARSDSSEERCIPQFRWSFSDFTRCTPDVVPMLSDVVLILLRQAQGKKDSH